MGVVRCIRELQVQGYPNRLLKKWVAGVIQKELREARVVAQRYLKACKDKYGFGSMARHEVHDLMYELHFEGYCTWELHKADARRPE